jgi:hypothetical protein
MVLIAIAVIHKIILSVGHKNHKEFFMKNKVFSACFIGIWLVAGFVFAGCTSTGDNKLYSDFMLPSIPKEEHAVLIVDSYIDITRINGQLLHLFTMSGSSTRQIIPLPAGTYDLQVYYQKTSKVMVKQESFDYTAASEELTHISHDFSAGRHYLLTTDANVTNTNVLVTSVVGITFGILDVTDISESILPGISDLIGKAKVKEPDPWSIGYVKKEPTKFEGTWKNDKGSYVMSFSGNTVVWTPGSGGVLGNFSFTDDKLTIYITSALPSKRKSSFKYTLESDVLTLFDWGIPLPLRKQNN